MIYDPFNSNACDTSSLNDRLDVISAKLDEAPILDFSEINIKLDSIYSKLDSLPANTGQVGTFVAKTVEVSMLGSVTNHKQAYPLNVGYFYALECNRSCRVRGYSNQDQMLTDSNRATTIVPTSNEINFDLLVSKVGSTVKLFYLSPIAIFAGTILYLNVDNLSNNDLSVSLKYVG